MPIKRDVNGVPMQLLILGDAAHATTVTVSQVSQSVAVPQGVDAVRLYASVGCTVTATVGVEPAVVGAGVALVAGVPEVFAINNHTTHINIVAGGLGTLNIAW